MSERCPEGVWCDRVSVCCFGGCLEGFWSMSGICLEGVWRVSGGCLESVWRVSGSRLIYGNIMILYSRCMQGISMCGRVLEISKKVSGKYMESVWKVSGMWLECPVWPCFIQLTPYDFIWPCMVL